MSTVVLPEAQHALSPDDHNFHDIACYPVRLLPLEASTRNVQRQHFPSGRMYAGSIRIHPFRSS